MSEEYWDYLVVGGDFHGHVLSGPARLHTLDVPLEDKRMAKFQSPHTPSEITVPLTLPHAVYDHFCEGKRYAVAIIEEESLTNFDVDALIVEFTPSPH